MKLSELEALAKATLVNPHGGYPYELYMPYITAATPETILRMIALIRRLGDALEKAIALRVSLWRNGDFEGDFDSIPDEEIALKDAYAKEWVGTLNELKEFEK